MHATAVRRFSLPPHQRPWLLGALLLLAAIAVAELVSPRSVALTALAVFAPLVACIRLPPFSVAAVGALAVLVTMTSPLWADAPATPQHGVRVGVVVAGSVLAVLIAAARTGLERERRIDDLFSRLVASTTLPPETLVQGIATALVPEFASAARVVVRAPTHTAPLRGEAGDTAMLGAAPSAPWPDEVVLGRTADGCRTLTGALRIGGRELGGLVLARDRQGFASSEVALVRRMIARVALALENALLLAESRESAALAEDAHRRLGQIVEQMPAAVTIRDHDGHTAVINRRALEIRDRATAGAVDPDAWFAAHPGRRADGAPIAAEDWPHIRALRSGETVRAEEYQFDRYDGSSAVARVYAAPIRERDGSISAVVSVFDDVTDQHHDRRALGWLAEVGRILDRPHTAAAGVAEILNLLATALGAAGLVYLTRPDGSIGVSVTAIPTEDLREAAETLADRDRRDIDPAHPAAASTRDRRTVILGTRADDEPGHAAWLQASGFRAAVFVPIAHAQHSHGCLALMTRERHAPTPRDIETVELVARRVALALENSRLYAEQHRVATALQRDLLPRALPEWPGLDLATLYQPARGAADVGGDFFDLFDARGEHVAVVGDVSGKGVEAAATTALVRHVARVAARSGGERLSTINQALVEDAPGEQFCTLAWAALRRRDDGAFEGEVACAGHPPPVVLRAAGGVDVLPATGTLLGLFDDIRAQIIPVRLDPGDALVMYTDGVTEARLADRSLFGLEGLIAALDVDGLAGAPAGAILEAVEDALTRADARDDVAIVVAGVLP